MDCSLQSVSATVRVYGRWSGSASRGHMRAPMNYWSTNLGQRQSLPGAISQQCGLPCTVTRTGHQLGYAGYPRPPKIIRWQLKLLGNTASMKLSRAEMRNKKIFCVGDLIGSRVQYIGTRGIK